MATKTNWRQNGKRNKIISNLLVYIIFFSIIGGMAYYYADKFGEYFSWLLENDYINETQCKLLNQTMGVGIKLVTFDIVKMSFSAFVLLIFLQNIILTLFLPKKQLLEKVISFNPAIDQLDILYNEKAIDFVKNNKIKIYLADEPFSRKEEIRENCFAKYIYYAGDAIHFNRGKIEQYLGQNRLCFDYNDFEKYKDELKNYKNTILKIELEKNNREHADEINTIKSENNKREQEIKEEYEKKLQNMQKTMDRINKHLHAETLDNENNKNKLIEKDKQITRLEANYKSELGEKDKQIDWLKENHKNKLLEKDNEISELKQINQELINGNNSEIARSYKRSPFYFFVSRTHIGLKSNYPGKKFVTPDLEQHFWKCIDKYERTFPKLKQEIMELFTDYQHNKELTMIFPDWAKNILKECCSDIRQTTGGRPSSTK